MFLRLFQLLQVHPSTPHRHPSLTPHLSPLLWDMWGGWYVSSPLSLLPSPLSICTYSGSSQIRPISMQIFAVIPCYGYISPFSRVKIKLTRAVTCKCFNGIRRNSFKGATFTQLHSIKAVYIPQLW